MWDFLDGSTALTFAPDDHHATRAFHRFRIMRQTSLENAEIAQPRNT